jgi:hypothetical protein
MPSRNEVVEEILNTKHNAEHIIRRKYLQAMQAYTGRDTVVYAAAFTANKLADASSYYVSITPEDIQGFMSALYGLKGKELDLILHSPGGSLEAVDQIVQYLRSKYTHIRVIVPQNAMSAASIIACAADEIVMGQHSAIGPIDPQISFPTQNGHFTAPAQEILDEFQRARLEVIAEPAVAPLWSSKMKDYPPGLLEICESTIALSKEKTAEWLAAYMLKGQAGAADKAQEIAAWLGDANLHKTHGRPIMLAQVQELGLTVTPLEADQDLQQHVMAVFHATEVMFEISNCMKFVENHEGKGWFVAVEAPPPGAY